MLELLFSEVNIVLTILSIVFIAYWLVTMLFGLDLEIDFDVDIDIDADFDSEINMEGGELDVADAANVEVDPKQVVGNRRKPLKWWQVLLIHFNFVGVPFMFTFTCFVLTLWILTLLATMQTGTHNVAIGFLWIPALFIPALYITKLFTSPFKSFFNLFNRDGNASVEIIGKMGIMMDTVRGGRIARAEIIHENSPLIINVKSLNQEKIERGENVLIIKSNKEKTIYFVQADKTSILNQTL